MNFERRSSRAPKYVKSGLAALILIASGCGESENTYTAIQMPDTARALGFTSEAEGVKNGVREVPGLSFLVHIDDVSRVSCGAADIDIPASPDEYVELVRRVTVIDEHLAQVDCLDTRDRLDLFGVSLPSLPIEKFPGTPLPGSADRVESSSS